MVGRNKNKIGLEESAAKLVGKEKEELIPKQKERVNGNNDQEKALALLRDAPQWDEAKCG